MTSNKRPEGGFTQSQLQNQEFLASTQPSKIDRIRSNIHPKVNVLPPNSLPLWKDYPLDKKFPKVPANDDKFVFARNQIGQSVFVSTPRQKFDNEDPRLQATPTGYTSLHDPHLKEYFEKHPKVFDRLVKEGLVDPEDGGVKTDMKAFNEYRAYLARLRNIELDDEVRTQNKLADAQRDQLKRIKMDANSSEKKKRNEQKAQALSALKRDRAARELRNQLKEFKQASGMAAADKARQDAEAALKRELLRDKVRARLAKLRRGERRRARKLILEFYCKQLYADMLRNALKEHKKKERHADLESFVDAKREFQTAKMEYMKALEEKRKAEKECHVNARRKHFDHVENHRIENLKKRALQAQRAAEREAYLIRKFGMRWLNAVRQQRENAKTYHESVWHVRQQLMVMVKELKKESGKVSFTNFIHGLVSLRPGAAEPLPKMSDETKAIMNYILDLLIQTALDEYRKQHDKCKEAYAKQARRRDILGKPHLTEKDFEPPPYSPREKPVIPFERPTFPCKHPCTDIKPWMKEHGTCNECEEDEDEYNEAYDMVDEELRRIMSIATPREQDAIREIVGSDSSGEAEGVVSNSIKKSVEKLARDGFSNKIPTSKSKTKDDKRQKKDRSPRGEPSKETPRAASPDKRPRDKEKKGKAKEQVPPSSDSSAVAEQEAKVAIRNSLAKLAEEPTESEGSSAVAEKVVSKSLTNVQADLERPKEPEKQQDKPEEQVQETLKKDEPKEETKDDAKIPDDASEGSSGVAEEIVRKSLANVTSGMLKESKDRLLDEEEQQDEAKKLDEAAPQEEKQVTPDQAESDEKQPITKDDTKAKDDVPKDEPARDDKGDEAKQMADETRPDEKEKKPDEEKSLQPDEKEQGKEPKPLSEKPVDKEKEQDVGEATQEAPDEQTTDEAPQQAPDESLDETPVEADKSQVDEAPKETPLDEEKQLTDEEKSLQPDEEEKEPGKPEEEPKEDAKIPADASEGSAEVAEEIVRKSLANVTSGMLKESKDRLMDEEEQQDEAKKLDEAAPQEEKQVAPDQAESDEKPSQSEDDTTPTDDVPKDEPANDDKGDEEKQLADETRPEEKEKKPDEPDVISSQDADKSNEDDMLQERESSDEKQETLGEGLEQDTSQHDMTQDTEHEGAEEDEDEMEDLARDQDTYETEIPDSEYDEMEQEQTAQEYEPDQVTEQTEVKDSGSQLLEEFQDSCTSFASSSSSSGVASELVSTSLQKALNALKCKEQEKVEYDSCGEPESGTGSSSSDPSDIVKKSILRAVESLTCKEQGYLAHELDSCDSLSDTASVSSGEAEGIVAKAIARVVESLRCHSQGDGPTDFNFTPLQRQINPDDARKSSFGQQPPVHAYQMSSDSSGGTTQTHDDHEQVQTQGEPGAERDHGSVAPRASQPNQKRSGENIRQRTSHPGQTSEQPDSAGVRASQQRTSQNSGTQPSRYSEPGGIVHRYDQGPIDSGDCESVINEMAKAVVKTILPQGLFTRYSFSDESVTPTYSPPPTAQLTEAAQSPEPAQPAIAMPQDLRESVLRTLSNVQEQLDAIRHELQIHGVIP